MKKNSLQFKHSKTGTLGVEMEWITVDTNNGAQIGAAPKFLASIEHSPRIKPELFTSTVELNTDIHHATINCMEEMQSLYQQASDKLQLQNVALLSSGTHPFSRWQEQSISEDPRYARLVERLQWVARRFNIFGVHVHIGMPDGDTCISTMNRLLPIMPVFLAMSANSPFWCGHDTGLSSTRIKIFEGLSQGGMPFYFENWQDFCHCAERLIATRSIDSVRDIWWEMRPHPDFGTLEIRIGDMPASKADATAYVAYVRAECMAAGNLPESPRTHPSLIRENRWRACRYGVQATMISPETEKLVPILDWLESRLPLLAEHGADQRDIDLVTEHLPRLRKRCGGASIQRQLMKKLDSLPNLISTLRQQDGWSSNVI